jgi:hypothetical protein
MKKYLIGLGVLGLLFTGCTQEQQNKISRGVQNWTGVNGVVDIYSGGKLMKRFIKIDKLTTATATDGTESRAYRYGYGYIDSNFNYKVDKDEKKVYFEISNYSTQYVFYENPTK